MEDVMKITIKVDDYCARQIENAGQKPENHAQNIIDRYFHPEYIDWELEEHE
jgi:hypothetical protein